jgi:hypothetical protein
VNAGIFKEVQERHRLPREKLAPLALLALFEKIQGFLAQMSRS